VDPLSRKRALAAAIVAAASATVLVPIGVTAYVEREIEARAAELRARAVLPELDPGVLWWTWRVAPRLAELDRWRAAQPGAEAHRRCLWAPELRAELAETLAPLDTYFAAIDGVLDPYILCGLEEPPEETPLPRQVVSRELTTLLCGKAVLAAAQPDGSTEAVRRLEQALSLLDLEDDGSLVALAFRARLVGVVLDAVRTVAASEAVDAAALQQALEPALARVAANDRCGRGLRTDFLRFADALEPGHCPRGCDLAAHPHSIGTWQTFLALGDYREAFDRAERPYFVPPAPNDAGGSVRGGLLDSTLLVEIHQRGRVAVARAGLALAAHRQETGDWPEALDELGPRFHGDAPRDPSSGQPLEYGRAGERVWVACAGDPADGSGLQRWEWAR
jgi:hypothetical protein